VASLARCRRVADARHVLGPELVGGHTGHVITFGVTTLSDGGCSFQTNLMHWWLTRLPADGTKSKDSADVQLKGDSTFG
jgi:hypothetical protein